MINRIIIAIGVILLGGLIVTVPIYIFPVCAPLEVISPVVNVQLPANVTIKYMKCHWTAQAEIGVGLIIIAIGLIMLLAKSALIRLGLSLSLICMSVLVAAIPTVLIGVCPAEMMPCHIGTLPALLLLSGTLFMLTIMNTIYLHKLNRK